jgi:GDP-4-dehydro-6-deoxy-D-mannose reductase
MANPTLVIGAGSFIGRHLVARLRAGGAEVVGTARQVVGRSGFVTCDLCDADAVERVVKEIRPARIFQCAAVTSAGEAPEALYRLHVNGTLHLLRAVSRYAADAALIAFGSAAEYGRVSEECLPIYEEQPPGALSFYGASKLAQTYATAAAAAEWGLRVLIVRPFNVLGPGLPGHYVAAAIAQRLLQEGQTDGPFPVANAGATRDFLDVRDVAEACVLLTERAVPSPGAPQVYNVASGVETPVLAVAERLCALAGQRRAVDEGASRSRSGIARSRGDATRLQRATGWAPRITLEQSLADMWREIQRPTASAA